MLEPNAKWSTIRSPKSASKKLTRRSSAFVTSVILRSHRIKREGIMQLGTKRCSGASLRQRKRRERMIGLCSMQMRETSAHSGQTRAWSEINQCVTPVDQPPEAQSDCLRLTQPLSVRLRGLIHAALAPSNKFFIQPSVRKCHDQESRNSGQFIPTLRIWSLSASLISINSEENQKCPSSRPKYRWKCILNYDLQTIRLGNGSYIEKILYCCIS